MCEASCSRALRTSMNGLRGQWSQRSDTLGCFFQRQVHACTGRSADHIVTIERGVERTRRIKILREFFPELPQLIELQIAEFHAFIDCEPNCVSNPLVRRAEGNALEYQVSC